jgi:8-oxo-dGTP diphosphatase
MTAARRIAFCAACGTALPAAPPVRCPGCRTDVYADARPCAGALVVRDRAVLLVRRAGPPWRGSWDVPGGHCHLGEHPAATALRETYEETGLRVRLTGLFGVWLQPGAPGDPSDAGTLNVYYLATDTGEPAAAPDPAETLETAWFEPDRLPADLAFPEHVPDVLRAWAVR